ncbi:hypothetical protein F5Y00DRAFT_222348 [Daldinia vernicosa]|uniref:uncharacterized protein n=1 Tax=Daldinia vernicosa TaxID=114800 RepID=UPI002007C1AC|nr:uncharacterized protein F5Y00DRAFT_222348 [Daldinia vernicosa]KAI0854117.1 hypothetical protein F5Y00DRAFT_222348 [Daldinia vernicosa]
MTPPGEVDWRYVTLCSSSAFLVTLCWTCFLRHGVTTTDCWLNAERVMIGTIRTYATGSRDSISRIPEGGIKYENIAKRFIDVVILDNHQVTRLSY